MRRVDRSADNADAERFIDVFEPEVPTSEADDRDSLSRSTQVAIRHF